MRLGCRLGDAPSMRRSTVLPLFGKRPAPLSDAERDAASVDLDRIAHGGIPLGAEERLTALSTAEGGVFSSDLRAKEYAIAQASGLQPLAQVMGSSVVQHGWQNYGWQAFGGGIQEMPAFAQPWNLSRIRSFDRLRQEAKFAGADAVIGIELKAGSFLGEPGNVEYVVFGTAVRETTLAPGDRHTKSGRSGPKEPRLCALSAQDVDKLRRIGAETLGVIGHTAVVAIALSRWASQQMGRWWGNSEMVEVTQAVYAARQLAMNEIRRQGTALGANDMVISTLTHNIQHHEYESMGYTNHFFIVSMHVLGTAIRLGAHEPHPAPLGMPMMSVNLGDQ
jgi:uncharacterized protein YbjQ (UPF0145 family)